MRLLTFAPRASSRLYQFHFICSAGLGAAGANIVVQSLMSPRPIAQPHPYVPRSSLQRRNAINITAGVGAAIEQEQREIRVPLHD